MKINGKVYSMWGQFVERKDEWIGNILEDYHAGITKTTTITNITLKSNGKESAYFQIEGKDFSCGFDVRFGGISHGEAGWMTFSGYYAHTFRIKNTENNND